MKLRLLGMLLMSLAITAGCDNAEEKGGLYYVELSNLMQNSHPAELGQERLKEIQTRFQATVEDVRKAYADATPEQQQAAVNDAVNTLNRQLQVEKANIDREVRRLIEEACETWRAAHEAGVVVSMEMASAGDPSQNITEDIRKGLAESVPNFPEIPTISVNKDKLKEVIAAPKADQPAADAKADAGKSDKAEKDSKESKGEKK